MRLLSAACVVTIAIQSPALLAQCDGPFRRGDTNTDTQTNIADVVFVLKFLFRGGDAPSCRDTADADDDGKLELTDGVYLLDFLFMGGPCPPSPFASCDRDPTDDGMITCLSYSHCFRPPPIEICDGVDNDCDGEIDEDVDTPTDPENCGACGNRCADLALSNVASYSCENGQCSIDSCDEGYFDTDRIADNGCELGFPSDGSPCDDGNPCTENDRVSFGICGGTPRSCSERVDACNDGRCDPDTGECVARPRPGRPCDDGNVGTLADQCDDEGVCRGILVR